MPKKQISDIISLDECIDAGAADDNVFPDDVMPYEELSAEDLIYPGLILKNDYVLLKKIGFGNNASI
jgi:hypothetical protein